jgi:hypothetical protein
MTDTATKNKTVTLLMRGKSLLGDHDVKHELELDLAKFEERISKVWEAVFGRKPRIEIEKDVDEEGDFYIRVDQSYYIYLNEIELSDEEMFARTINLNDYSVGGENKVLRLTLGAIIGIPATYWEPEDCDEVDIAYSATLAGIIGELVQVEVKRIMDNVWEGYAYEDAFKDEEFPF